MIEKYLTVGIDCDTHGRLAIYDLKQNKIIETRSTDFCGAFKFLKNLNRNTIKVIVEVPTAFVYKRNNKEKGQIRDKMCFLIGDIRRKSQLTAIGCRLLGFSVKKVAGSHGEMDG